jgi:hypothetical protein
LTEITLSLFSIVFSSFFQFFLPAGISISATSLAGYKLDQVGVADWNLDLLDRYLSANAHHFGRES